ncbi:MAG: ABC transporter substrate-binding protein [Burkholderiales bacterium]|nr:ABC transporter substrate-binding protein [Burkholderiales bacterium]
MRTMMKTLLSLLGAGAAIALHAQPLTLVTEHYPPFNIVHPEDDDVGGSSADKLRELMRRAGEDYSIKSYSWSRAFQMGNKVPDTCVFSTTRSPEREAMFKWVGPLVKNDWVVFARAGERHHPATLEQLRPYVMGTYRYDAIAEFLALRGYKTELANVDTDNPRKLLYGRFDYWATGALMGKEILRQQGLSGQIVPLFRFYQSEMYLACHPGMAQDRIDRLNRILKEMEKDGTLAAIEKKYQ